jgi:hypothetical protein
MSKEDMRLYEKYDKELKQMQKVMKENNKKLEEIKDGKRKRIYNR